jgi:hypothetical protein
MRVTMAPTFPTRRAFENCVRALLAILASLLTACTPRDGAAPRTPTPEPPQTSEPAGEPTYAIELVVPAPAAPAPDEAPTSVASGPPESEPIDFVPDGAGGRLRGGPATPAPAGNPAPAPEVALSHIGDDEEAERRAVERARWRASDPERAPLEIDIEAVMRCLRRTPPHPTAGNRMQIHICVDGHGRAVSVDAGEEHDLADCIRTAAARWPRRDDDAFVDDCARLLVVINPAG